MIKVEHFSAEKILLRVNYLFFISWDICEESIKIADVILFFFKNVPRQLHISCAIRRKMWARNKGLNEPKLLTFYAEYRMNTERKMSDVAAVWGTIEKTRNKRIDNYRYPRMIVPRVTFRILSFPFFSLSRFRKGIYQDKLWCRPTDSWFTDFEIGSRNGLESAHSEIMIERHMIGATQFEWIKTIDRIY